MFCPDCHDRGIQSPMTLINVGDGRQITGQEYFCDRCEHSEPKDDFQEPEDLPHELSKID